VCQIFPHHELMAEHYLYVPLAGVIIMVSPLLAYVLEKKQKAALGLFIVIVVLFGLRTVERNRDWRDGMTLWSGVVKAAPESARGHDNLGVEYFRRKDFRTALKHAQEAVRLRPRVALFHNNLGMVYGALGDIDNAEKEFLSALEHNSRFAKALNNLGKIYYFKGDYKKAAWCFSYSVKLEPGILEDMGPLGAMVYFCEGKQKITREDFTGARQMFEKALQLKPDYGEAQKELRVLRNRGTAAHPAGPAP
jgi:protein O-mannosyl-transferase